MLLFLLELEDRYLHRDTNRIMIKIMMVSIKTIIMICNYSFILFFAKNWLWVSDKFQYLQNNCKNNFRFYVKSRFSKWMRNNYLLYDKVLFSNFWWFESYILLLVLMMISIITINIGRLGLQVIQWYREF